MISRSALNRLAPPGGLAYLASGLPMQAEIVAAATGVLAPWAVVNSLRIVDNEGMVFKERLRSPGGPIEHRPSEVGERIPTVWIRGLNFDQDHPEPRGGNDERRRKELRR